jgi:Spy/CpxP family protein refolding chaperone
MQDRQALETRFRERFRSVVRDRLSASEDQVNKLLEIEQRLGARRFELFRRERDVRREMRAAISAQTATDDAAMAQLITQSIQLQKQRIDLLETEQRELAAFLSPRQRVMYMGLQEQLRRQMEEVRDRREEGGSGVRRPRRPGGESPGPATLRRPG